uniref:Uncharacterized protein n=1 Tax=Zea mays TaxID=4577 RepID=C0PP05_MAIZE|nr:unknown [Zea mays]
MAATTHAASMSFLLSHPQSRSATPSRHLPLRPAARRVQCATDAAALSPAVTTKHRRAADENIREEAARHPAPKQGLSAWYEPFPPAPNGDPNVRVHGGHLGRALRLLRRRGDPGHRLPPRQPHLAGAAHPAHRQRRHRALARHRLRRVHEAHQGGDRRAAYLPRQLAQLPPPRGAEDGGHRDTAAVRLGGARLGDRAGRQSGEHIRLLQGVRDVPCPRARRPRAAPRLRAGGQREPALRLLQVRLDRIPAAGGQADVRVSDPDRRPGVRRPGRGGAQGDGRHCRGGDGGRAHERDVARRPHRDVRLPAHRGRARRPVQAQGAARHRDERPHRGRQHGSRPQVLAVEDRLP